MLPSLLLLGMPSISNLTALISPSPLKPRKENLPAVVPWRNSVMITPGICRKICQTPPTFWLSNISAPRMLTELSTDRLGRTPVLLRTCTSPSVTAESSASTAPPQAAIRARQTGRKSKFPLRVKNIDFSVDRQPGQSIRKPCFANIDVDHKIIQNNDLLARIVLLRQRWNMRQIVAAPRKIASNATVRPIFCPKSKFSASPRADRHSIPHRQAAAICHIPARPRLPDNKPPLKYQKIGRGSWGTAYGRWRPRWLSFFPHRPPGRKAR